MEQDSKRFLTRIVWSMSTGLLWLFINMTWGIYKKQLIVQSSITIGNIIYFCWFITSLILIIKLNRRWWKEKFPHG
jgi:hypothetical protein